MEVGSSPVVDEVPAEITRRYRRLRALNIAVGVLLAAEAPYMLPASNDLALPVTALYLRTDPVAVTGPTMPQRVFSLRIGPAGLSSSPWRPSTICCVACPSCTAGTSAGHPPR